MLQMANYEFIRKEHFLHGKSIRRIARETDYSRQSVRKALKSLEIPQYTLTKEKSKPVIDAVKSIIIKWLEEDQKAPVKQKHTAKRIYDRLVAEHGFKGGESTIRAYVKTLRQEINAHIPQEFPMGEYAQFDWGTADIILNGQQTTIQLFCMRLTYSRKIFVKAFMNQKQEALLQGHVDAFDYFGGVPKTIVYDNLKTVVKRILKGKKREETERFIQLKSHYLFESDFCEPGKGNQKGQVEHLVKYARANFLVPLPKVDSLETLNQMLLNQCEAYDHRHVPHANETVGERYLQEKNLLLLLPNKTLECCQVVYVKSNRLSMVSFESNAYSVPASYVGKQLQLKVFTGHIEIFHRHKKIAVHHRAFGKREEIFQYDHYLDVLLQKPGAIAFAKPLNHSNLPFIYEEVRQQWKQKKYDPRDFIRLLLLHREVSPQLIEEAIQQAKEKQMLTYDVIKQLVYQKITRDELIQPMTIAKDSTIPRIKVTPPNLAQYDRLTKERRMIH